MMVNQNSSNLQDNEIMFYIDDNLLFLKNTFGLSIGLNEGKIKVLGGKIEVGIAYIENICDTELIRQHVIAPLQNSSLNSSFSDNDIITLMQTFYIPLVNTQKTNLMKNVINELLKGNTLLFLDDCNTAIIIQSGRVEKRSIAVPENESNILASRESFIEDIEINSSMIIKRLPVSSLKFETFTLGRLSRSTAKLIWIEGVTNSKILDEVKRRIDNIDIDVVDGAGVLAKLIQDKPTTIFSTYRQTERPDVVVKKLAEGHLAILCSNSPFALICPITFWDSFKTMDDYLESPVVSSLLRIIRIMAFAISTTISPLYLAFVTYNHTIVPPSLALNISIGREGVPFPSIIELIGMTIIIDIIREAGTRMPGMVGYFIGTLGAVIIGQAAVTAGYVSASLIIVVAFSAIASFAISSTILVNPSRVINYFLILLSGFLGMFGFLNGFFILLWNMVTLESFGVPYLYPVVPIEFQGWKDLFIRVPLRLLKKRLGFISSVNKNRISNK